MLDPDLQLYCSNQIYQETLRTEMMGREKVKDVIDRGRLLFIHSISLLLLSERWSYINAITKIELELRSLLESLQVWPRLLLRLVTFSNMDLYLPPEM